MLMRVTPRVKKQENHLEILGGGGGGVWSIINPGGCLLPPGWRLHWRLGPPSLLAAIFNIILLVFSGFQPFIRTIPVTSLLTQGQLYQSWRVTPKDKLSQYSSV